MSLWMSVRAHELRRDTCTSGRWMNYGNYPLEIELMTICPNISRQSRYQQLETNKNKSAHIPKYSLWLLHNTYHPIISAPFFFVLIFFNIKLSHAASLWCCVCQSSDFLSPGRNYTFDKWGGALLMLVLLLMLMLSRWADELMLMHMLMLMLMLMLSRWADSDADICI